MKKIVRLLPRAFLVFSFLFLFTQKTIYACNESACGSESGYYSCSPTSTCGDCPGCPGGPNTQTTNQIKNKALPDFLNNLRGEAFLNKMFSVLIRMGYVIGSIIFFYMLIFGAIRWITSSGDKGKLEVAQKQITSALVGLVILLLIFAIINLIETLFGISILNLTLPTLE